MTKLLNSSTLIAEGGVAFGTSGARGLVVDFTPEVCAAFTHAFIAVMRKEFDVKQMALAIDNRPSSPAMAQACAAALTGDLHGVLSRVQDIAQRQNRKRAVAAGKGVCCVAVHKFGIAETAGQASGGAVGGLIRDSVAVFDL